MPISSSKKSLRIRNRKIIDQAERLRINIITLLTDVLVTIYHLKHYNVFLITLLTQSNHDIQCALMKRGETDRFKFILSTLFAT